MQYKSFIMQADDSDLTKYFGMLLIALPKSETEEKLNENIIIAVSDDLFEKSKGASVCEDWRCDDAHFFKYIYSLQDAFSNPAIVRHVLGDLENIQKERIAFLLNFFLLFTVCYLTLT